MFDTPIEEMTSEEFQKQYHEFQTFVQVKAEVKAEKVNRVAVDFSVEAVELPPIGWCLVLRTVSNELRKMGLLPNV